MSEAKIKGSVIRSRLEVLRKHGALERVLAVLPEADRKVLQGLVLATTWYPFGMAKRLDEALAHALSPTDDRGIYLELGRASADANLTTVHKAYVRPDDPHHLLSLSSQIYAQYYDQGHRTYEKLTATSCVLKTFDAEAATLTDCLTVVGWHVRAIELSGGKHASVVETKCRARGDDHCEYLCSWTH